MNDWQVRFVALRPTLHHLTARDNVDRLRAAGRLESAATLMEQAGQSDWLRVRRRSQDGPWRLTIAGTPVVLCDQTPLVAANIDFEPGWDLPRLVEHLNRRVYFWPVGRNGPRRKEMNHRRRYASEQPAVIRCRTATLVTANPAATLQFACCNSGGTRRQNRGRRLTRGESTFRTADRCADDGVPRGDVEEVTLIGSAILPADAQVSLDRSARWEALFPARGG